MDREVLVRDVTTFTTRRLTPEGFLLGRAALTRAGILEYDASEIGVGSRGATVKLLRTEESVFNPDTMATVRASVITLDHPPDKQMVSPDNYRDLVVGNAVGEPVKENDQLVTDIIIRDPEAIAAVQSGKDQISIGHRMAFRDAKPGIGYDYQTTKPIVINHSALVDAGRAGDRVRVFDEEGSMTPEEMQKVADTIAGVLTAKNAAPDAMDHAQVASVVTNAMKPVLDSIATLTKQQQEATQAAEIAAAKEKAKGAADKLVLDTVTGERRRAKVVTSAFTLIPAAKQAALENAPVKDILVAAVGDAVTDAAVRSEDYLQGVLDGLVRDRKAAGGQIQTAAAADSPSSAYDDYVKSLETAYKGEAK